MIRFRQANAADVGFLVPLIAESSGGVWPAVWQGLAATGESAETAGEKYLANLSNDLCVANTVIAESDGNRLGLMTCFREIQTTSNTKESAESSPIADADGLAAALRPYRELSDPDSLFIAELCCTPESRGQGLGSQFLTKAKESALAQGLPRVSLRVFTENSGAVRLYQRFGFETVDQRPVVPHPEITVSGSVLLMACTV